MTPLNYDIVE